MLNNHIGKDPDSDGETGASWHASLWPITGYQIPRGSGRGQPGTARSDLRVGRLAAAVVLAGSLVLTSTPQVHAADKETSGVVLTSPNPGELVISWDAASPTPVDYRVMWAPSSGPFLSFRVDNTAEAGNAYPVGTSYTVTGLAEGVEYKVRVRARYGAARGGPWSPPATLEITATEEPPAKPTGVNLSSSHSSVLLEWDDPSDDTRDSGRSSAMVVWGAYQSL